MALTPTQQALALDAFLHGMGPIDISNRIGAPYDDVYAYLNNAKLEALRRSFDPIPSGSGAFVPSVMPPALSGFFASMPANLLVGQVFFATDTNQVFLGSTLGNLLVSTGGSGGGSGSASFSAVTSGVSVGQNLTVGDGSSLFPSGTGIVNATEINGIPITGALTHAGQIPISQPGNASAVWADPLVQGLFPEGTATSGINPVLMSGKGADGLQHSLSVDNSGVLNINAVGATFVGTLSQNLTQWASIVLGVPTPYGTAPSSGNYIGVNAYITNPVAVTGTFWQATQPVSGTFWQATQPVSGAISFTAPQHVIIDSGTLGTLTISGSVSVSNFPASQVVTLASTTITGSVAVTGTFWQATQPVSSTQLPAVLDGSGFLKVHEQGIVPVTGTFWQATQPVSGTFWQATQPISGAISFTAPQHVIIDSATLGTVTVSGTFWQATQPVSGTFWQATQPVSGTVAFSNTTIAVTNAGTFAVQAAQSGTWNIGTVTTVSAVTAITNALPAGSNTIGKVDILGNAGATLDATIGAAAAPTNALATLVVYKATPITLTTGQSAAVQGDTTGSTYVNTEGRKTTYRMCAKTF